MKRKPAPYLIALAGNPNVGKSTMFNALTGARQHTGNWTGKTVEKAVARCKFASLPADFIDLPGTYTLRGGSAEENIARDYITSGRADVTVFMTDAETLERGLILPLQALPSCGRAVLCLNLIDEAQKKGVKIDLEKLSDALGIPVIATNARARESVAAFASLLKSELSRPPRKRGVGRRPGAETCAKRAERIAARVVFAPAGAQNRGGKLDKILTSGRWGVPLIILFAGFLLYLTVSGANYPSQLLAAMFDALGNALSGLLDFAPAARDILIGGVYRTVALVVSVMLPPMSIFFPLFALLEEAGYLPRMAFTLDKSFERAGVSGKQALCMCMGVGCNAAGVTNCRIINSEKQRIVAVITNSFMPCNGRFPLMITLSALFFAANFFIGALTVLSVLILGVLLTLLASKILTLTILKEKTAHFSLELPAYRRPPFLKTAAEAFTGKALRILARAVIFSAPFSVLIILGGYVKTADGGSILNAAGNFLNPVGRALGVDGFIIMAFFLSLPANEIFLPVLLMCYTSSGALTEVAPDALRVLLADNGWTALTAVNTMLLSLLHFPCATTLLTIKKETNMKWTAAAFFLPLLFGAVLCLLTNGIASLFN